MKKLFVILLAIGLVMFMSNFVLAEDCITIQDQVLTYNHDGGKGTLIGIIPLGYDDWGYNYQGHMFNGWYWNNGRPDPAYTDEQSLIDAGKSTTWLMMKWSDEWLSNKDCNIDGKLDRGYSCNPENPTSSACAGAWLTNHQKGSYENEETGKTCKWVYFVKIVHPGEGALCDTIDIKGGCIGTWYTAEGYEIGPAIWSAYAKILQISNDTCAGEHGVLYHSEAPVGFGFYE